MQITKHLLKTLSKKEIYLEWMVFFADCQTEMALKHKWGQLTLFYMTLETKKNIHLWRHLGATFVRLT